MLAVLCLLAMVAAWQLRGPWPALDPTTNNKQG
jgi:hypothetical protein